MEPQTAKEFFIRYLNDECSPEELQQLVHYLAQIDATDLLEVVLDHGWNNFKDDKDENSSLREELLLKFYKKNNIVINK